MFSNPVEAPSCLTCTAYEDFTEVDDGGTAKMPPASEADEPVGFLLGGIFGPADSEQPAPMPQILELSAQVGAYQMAVLNGEATAARAFLENVVRIAQDLLR